MCCCKCVCGNKKTNVPPPPKAVRDGHYKHKPDASIFAIVLILMIMVGLAFGFFIGLQLGLEG